jgi:hypothetical protein
MLQGKQLILSEQDQALLKEIMRPGTAVDDIVPETATAQQLWDTLKVCVAGYNMLNFKLNRIKPIIGKILLIFQRNPHLYQELGYETFEDFRKNGIGKRLGVGRTTLWECQTIARDWPQLVQNPDRYAQIGRTKLIILSKFAKGTAPNAESLLNMAASMPAHELRIHSEQRGLLIPGETVPATVVVRGSLDMVKRWKEFSSDERVHQIVGSASQEAILMAMIDECYSHWVATYEDHLREQEKQSAEAAQTAAH